MTDTVAAILGRLVGLPEDDIDVQELARRFGVVEANIAWIAAAIERPAEQ